MALPTRWKCESGARVEGSRELDRSKVQALGIVRTPEGRYRLFYTGVGPGKPFADCQGYILSAVSDDGLSFVAEPGIRIAPDPAVRQMSLRVLAPSIIDVPDGGWRMYFEARGPADHPTAIMSATSDNQLTWRVEPGLRVSAPGGLGAPRFRREANGKGRLFCFESVYADGSPASGQRLGTKVMSAVTTNGIDFAFETQLRLPSRNDGLDSAGITAAEVIPGQPWRILFSAWQDVLPGTFVPPHPSSDPAAPSNGASADFAAASIAADMAGYRSRILMAHSDDGVHWEDDGVAVEGDGYGGTTIDAVHAEDMSVIELDDGRWRMYYAACDAHGVWRIASAISL